MGKREEIERIIEKHYQATYAKHFSEVTLTDIKSYFLNDAKVYKITYRKANDFYFYTKVLNDLKNIVPLKVVNLVFFEPNSDTTRNLDFLLENINDYNQFIEHTVSMHKKVLNIYLEKLRIEFLTYNPHDIYYLDNRLVNFMQLLHKLSSFDITYKDEFIRLANHYLNDTPKYEQYVRTNTPAIPFSLYLFSILSTIYSKEELANRLVEHIKTSTFIRSELPLKTWELLDEKAIELLDTILSVKHHDVGYYSNVIQFIRKINWLTHIDKIFSFGIKINHDNKLLLVKVLAKHPNEAFPKAQSSILSKKADERIVGYLTLLELKTPEALDLVLANFHHEKDDKKVREVIMPQIAAKLYGRPYSLEEVREIIAHAKARKKLEKWSEKELDESSLPPLYLMNGEELDGDMVRFLFYRMGFIKAIESDPEARLLIAHIDKSRSGAFARYLLQTFLDGGAKAAQKHYLALAALLGDEALLDHFKKLFNALFEEKRIKMLQYLVHAVALIDSMGSLRYLDYLTKKYKSKASIADTAREALTLYAREQGLSYFELLDQLIPDFGFDGLTLILDIGGHEYRVYIADDFKLRYIDEDDKILKSLPKAASKEQKEQVKEIQKLIREANRSQGDRLEYYMMIERRWDEESWRAFYLTNPLIFVYTSTLLWGTYDSEGNLGRLFYVDQDSSVLDIGDEEIEFAEGERIGIVHPLRLSAEQLSEWIDKFYELELNQPFPQLHRTIYRVPAEQREQTEITAYTGMQPKRTPSTIKSYLEKQGWQKEAMDAGMAVYYREYPEYDLYIELGVGGLFVYYWEDEEAEIYDTAFRKIGNYLAKVPLKDIPDIIYSEVISDLEAIVRG